MLADPMRYFSNENFSGLLLRRTTDELRELITKSQQLYPRVIEGMHWSERKSAWTSPSGATLWMTYLEQDKDAQRYHGQAFTWVGFDELTQWPTPYAWDYLRSRLRTTDPNLGLYMRATSNPGGLGHVWVKRMFIDPTTPGKAFWATDEYGNTLVWPKGHRKEGQPLFKRRFIPASLYDNPHLTHDDQYEANLISLPENKRKQLLEGNWDVAEGAAFPEFDRRVHVIEPFDIPPGWLKFRACDYGYGSATAVLWIAISPDEQLIVYRELYTKGVTASDLADEIKRIEAEDYNVRYGVLDSSLWHNRGDLGPSLAEVMIRKGVRWRPSDRSKGSRIAGKNEIHRRLQVDEFSGIPGLVFFNNCTECIAQIPSIPLDKDKPDDVDTKAEDHIYDALRYGVMTRPKYSVFDVTVPTQPSGFQMADSTFGY